jgi:hypothetical protein
LAATILGSARFLLIPAMAAGQALPASDAGEVSTSYTYLTENFYRKVDPQAVLDSVRTTLLGAMRTAGVKHAALPEMHANETPNGNIREIDREIVDAASQSKSKFTVHDLSYVALDGILRSVNDRYTVFMTPKEYAGLNQGLDGGDFGGTGIVIQTDDKTKFISVENVVPNGPADKAGVAQDDLITAIDGSSTKGMGLSTASGKLRGKEGTRVTLTIARDGVAQPAPITITRAKIHQLSVYEKMLPGKIGYVALTVFGRDTGDELNAALERLQRDGARALVLDLRDNGGGYLKPPSPSVRSSFRADRSFRSSLALRISRRSTPTIRRSRRSRSPCSSTAIPPRPPRSLRARFRTAASARSSERRRSAKASSRRSIRCPTAAPSKLRRHAISRRATATSTISASRRISSSQRTSARNSGSRRRTISSPARSRT